MKMTSIDHMDWSKVEQQPEVTEQEEKKMSSFQIPSLNNFSNWYKTKILKAKDTDFFDTYPLGKFPMYFAFAYIFVLFGCLSILKFTFIELPFKIPYKVFGSVFTLSRKDKKLKWYEVFITTFLVTAFDLLVLLFTIGFFAGLQAGLHNG